MQVGGDEFDFNLSVFLAGSWVEREAEKRAVREAEKRAKHDQLKQQARGGLPTSRAGRGRRR